MDFHKLNARTVKVSYSIPQIAETLQALSGAEWFCSLDLQSGYRQVKIASVDKAKTAMTTPFGLYKFNRIPFGLTNVPATFQRLMESCLDDLISRACLVYLDNVLQGFQKCFSAWKKSCNAWESMASNLRLHALSA